VQANASAIQTLSNEKGQPNGIATLGADGKVPEEQLPDDIGGGGEITQETFNDMLVEGLTANENTPTEEQKTNACDWLGAVEKIAYDSTDGSLQGRVYIVDKNNTQTSRELRVTAKADSIPVRNNNANFYVNTPQNQYECAPKGYVDGLTRLHCAYLTTDNPTKTFKKKAGAPIFISNVVPSSDGDFKRQTSATTIEAISAPSQSGYFLAEGCVYEEPASHITIENTADGIVITNGLAPYSYVLFTILNEV
jgi:hypothetical protein